VRHIASAVVSICVIRPEAGTENQFKKVWPSGEDLNSMIKKTLPDLSYSQVYTANKNEISLPLEVKTSAFGESFFGVECARIECIRISIHLILGYEGEFLIFFLEYDLAIGTET
jgi:hypothetical protein